MPKTKLKKTPAATGKNGKSSNVSKPRDTLAQVKTWMIEGHSYAQILETLETWGLPPKAGTALIKAALHHLEKALLIPAHTKKALTEAAVWHLYQQMTMVGDFPGALSALREFSKLNSLHDPIGPTHPQPPKIIEETAFFEEDFH